MKFSLHPYGPLVDVLGVPPQTFECQADTAATLLAALHQAFPDLNDWKGRIALAVGENLLTADDEVPDGAEVALIPPVSGG